MVYKIRSKPGTLKKQIKSPELEVSTEKDYFIGDSQIYDICDIDPYVYLYL